jgi:RimJ/RimL family protein N-acetyltransferase
MIVWDKHLPHLRLANQLLHVSHIPQDVYWRALCDEQGRPLIIVIYTRWTPWNVEITVLSLEPKAVSRGFIRSCLAFAFSRVGRVTVIVRAEDARTLNLVLRLGFVREARLARWFGQQDGVVFRLLKEECKWRVEHEKALAAAA